MVISVFYALDTINGLTHTAVPWQKDPTDIVPVSLFQLYYLHTKHELSHSQTQTEDDNSFVCALPRLTDFQCRSLLLNFLTSCATANYVNGIVERHTRVPMSVGSFCHGMEAYTKGLNNGLTQDHFMM